MNTTPQFKLGEIVVRSGSNNGNGAKIGQEAVVEGIDPVYPDMLMVRYKGCLKQRQNGCEVWLACYTEKKTP